MATVYIREDGTGDYTTLAAAITANETDVEIHGVWLSPEDSTSTIDTTGTTVTAIGASKHPGYIGSTPKHWRLRPSSSSVSITVSAADVSLIGLDIRETSHTTSSARAIRCTGYDNLSVDGCLVHGYEQTAHLYPLEIYNVAATTISITIENSIIYRDFKSYSTSFKV